MTDMSSRLLIVLLLQGKKNIGEHLTTLCNLIVHEINLFFSRIAALPTAAEVVFNEYNTSTTTDGPTVRRSISSIVYHPFYK